MDGLCPQMAETKVQDPACEGQETRITIPEDLPEVIVHKDIDDDDRENPECCTEYVQEIFAYMKECETRNIYAISNDFLVKQPNWTSWHRSILINWLVEVHQRYQFVQETLFITVDCFDRYVEVCRGYIYDLWQE